MKSMVMQQASDVSVFLVDVTKEFSAYLETRTLNDLLAENENCREEIVREYISSLRRLLVFGEEALDACELVLNNAEFHKGAAEKVLYGVYHQIIGEFFAPKKDIWYEDSRSAYTGKNCIKFRGEVPASLQELFSSVEGKFQHAREELEYYETDYRTKMNLKQEG